MTRLFTSFLLISLISHSPIYAQWYKPEKVGKKAAAEYTLGLESADAGDLKDALLHFTQAIKIDGKLVDAYLSRAGVNAEMKNYRESIDDFERAIGLDSVYTLPYLLPYSISLAGTGAFVKADEAVERFLAIPGINEKSRRAAGYRKSVYEFAIRFGQEHDTAYQFEPLNLGDEINSSSLEYYPSLTIDGSKLIYTRRVENDEDFFESELNQKIKKKSTPLEGMINTNYNEGAQNISQDGRWLVFAGCNYPEGMGSCDLYLATQAKNGEWGEPRNLGDAINSEYWESSPSLSPDKKDLYFSSNRPGGYGGKDLWVSHLLPTGKWSKPENLGPSINTDGDEGSAFIHADNQSLYFNSNGHMGYGAADIFLVRRDSAGQWSEAKNLGYPINTMDEEGSLIVAADGQTAYYASDRSDSRGGLDLYQFNIRKEYSAAATIWVKGKVTDAKTGAGLPSRIDLTDINTRRQIYSLQTDEEGDYLLPLPHGKDYAFSVRRKGYLFYSENFSLRSDSLLRPLVINIPLQPVVAGANIVLKNIFFDQNKFSLKTESTAELDLLVTLMQENPNLKIEISGHTDNVGSAADNNTLSLNRAKAVTEYLTGKGIASGRMSNRGFGSTKPVAGNDTEKGKALNRRTELRVISN
jgi:outer membrane protein OmpA-like peptidoglycan-associated protein/Tol biopolymer transport system component